MISIILPSVRPIELIKCVAAINEARAQVQIELIIVADFECIFTEELIENMNIKWIYVKERKGVVHAINIGESYATGNYLLSLSDEAILQPMSLWNLRCFSIVLNDSALITPRHIPHFPFFYYGKRFAPFPFVHKGLIEKLGGFIDPAFKAFYADPDLGMRAWAAGIPVSICQEAYILHPNNMSCPVHVHNVNEYLEQDRATFRGRWDHLGEFRDP